MHIKLFKKILYRQLSEKIRDKITLDFTVRKILTEIKYKQEKIDIGILTPEGKLTEKGILLNRKKQVYGYDHLKKVV